MTDLYKAIYYPQMIEADEDDVSVAVHLPKYGDEDMAARNHASKILIAIEEMMRVEGSDNNKPLCLNCVMGILNITARFAIDSANLTHEQAVDWARTMLADANDYGQTVVAVLDKVSEEKNISEKSALAEPWHDPKGEWTRKDKHDNPEKYKQRGMSLADILRDFMRA